MPVRRLFGTVAVGLIMLSGPTPAQPIICAAPIAPFLPNDPRDVREYADLLRRDFETYITDFQVYLRCLDAERARAMSEGQTVTESYGRFQRITQGPGLANGPGSM